MFVGCLCNMGKPEAATTLAHCLLKKGYNPNTINMLISFMDNLYKENKFDDALQIF